jgi:hypothetical protein
VTLPGQAFVREHPTLGSRMINDVSEAVGRQHVKIEPVSRLFGPRNHGFKKVTKAVSIKDCQWRTGRPWLKLKGGWTDGGLVCVSLTN